LKFCGVAEKSVTLASSGLVPALIDRPDVEAVTVKSSVFCDVAVKRYP
jgi:hypothetical protein